MEKDQNKEVKCGVPDLLQLYQTGGCDVNHIIHDGARAERIDSFLGGKNLSPGIYYRSELDHNGISVYTGTIISDWGGRLELEIDRKARIWARVSRKQKISILVLSSAMGSNLREILENVCGDPVFSESLCKELQKKFFQQRCELGRIGRRNMNRRLNLDIPQNNTFLLPRDILAAADHLIGMKFGMGILDDMNHLKNKRIRSVADLLQDQFGLALVRLENMDELLVFGYAISTLVTTDAFVLLIRPKESMLDLLDPYQFMRGLVLGDL
ncbi:hypothetical protein F8388_016710 [Cannabis sativa]|uniref:DNA-directed RNA polymerase n=1 Tax=Cannabis sativa TaxID=3483 RepID=A0A7J6GWZ0_CANSA|nr:hypothetical protein F8388_016710 [Cannabis sativa]